VVCQSLVEAYGLGQIQSSSRQTICTVTADIVNGEVASAAARCVCAGRPCLCTLPSCWSQTVQLKASGRGRSRRGLVRDGDEPGGRKGFSSCALLAIGVSVWAVLMAMHCCGLVTVQLYNAGLRAWFDCRECDTNLSTCVVAMWLTSCIDVQVHDWRDGAKLGVGAKTRQSWSWPSKQEPPPWSYGAL